MDQYEMDATVPDAQPEAEAGGGQGEKLKSVAREVAETLLLAVVIWLGVNFATARFVVEGNSMEPNLHTGEFVIVSRLAYMLGEPQRGDVVVLHPPTNPDQEYIKRVVGLPGDTVEVQAGQVYVNGALLDEPYISVPTPQSGRWTVGEDEYFVMGDNRTNSDDSRKWGQKQLVAELIVGKAWLIYWPPREWGVIPHQEVALTSAQAASSAVTPTATPVPPNVSIEGVSVENAP